jgi:hypothetical protein
MHYSDFIPRKDADLLKWVINFLTVLGKILTRVGFPDAVYQALVTLKDSFDDKLTVADAPETRTKPAILAKNLARKTLVRELRQATGEYLTRNHLLSDVDRENLGLKPHSEGRHPSPIADKSPDADVDTSTIGQLKINFYEKGGHHKKGKPDGQHCAEIAWMISDIPPTRWDELLHSAVDTNSPFSLVFENDRRGKTVYFALRWENTRGEKGPWSEIMNAIIP